MDILHVIQIPVQHLLEIHHTTEYEKSLITPTWKKKIKMLIFTKFGG